MSDLPSRKKLSAEAARAAMAELPGWELDEEKWRIRKTFKTRGFSGAVGLVARIAVIAAAFDHHPDIDIRFDKVRVAYSTHDAGGLTGFDIACAKAIEEKGDPI